MVQAFTSTANGFFFGLDHREHSIALLFLFEEWEIEIVFEAIICYLLFVSSCVIVQMNYICILSYDIRIPLNMSLNNISSPALFVQLRSKSGLMFVPSNWFKGWFMVTELFHQCGCFLPCMCISLNWIFVSFLHPRG